jgi:hypothetical protein
VVNTTAPASHIGRRILADGVFNLLYSASNYDDLPAVLRVLEARDAAPWWASR